MKHRFSATLGQELEAGSWPALPHSLHNQDLTTTAISSAFPYVIGFGAVAVVLIILTRGRLDYGRLAEAH